MDSGREFDEKVSQNRLIADFDILAVWDIVKISYDTLKLEIAGVSFSQRKIENWEALKEQLIQKQDKWIMTKCNF